MTAYINESFIEFEKAVLHVSDLAFQRGYAVFDFFRTKNQVPLFLNDYLDRLFSSADGLQLHPPLTRVEIKNIIHQLIQKNNLSQSGIRITLTGGYSGDGYLPATPNLVIVEQPLQMATQKFSTGLKVITHEYQRTLPSVKSTDYLLAIWLQEKIREQEADDVLYYKNGFVTEFPRSNLFIITKEKVLVTPSQNILRGITRLKVLELARGKMDIEERDLHLDEVKNASEVFMTSTTKRILPVVQVDDCVIGEGKPGSATILLNKLFLELEQSVLASTF